MKKQEFEDDGRTVADMGAFDDRPSLLSGLKNLHRPKSGTQDKPLPDASFSPSQRGMYVLGALTASLLIGLVFAVGIGAVILILWLLF